MNEKTENLDKYYEEQFAMMTSPGWVDLLEDLGRQKQAAVDTILKVRVTEAEYQFLRGRIEVLDDIITRKELWEKTYKDLKEDNDANV